VRIELKKKEPGVMWRCLGRPVERQALFPTSRIFGHLAKKSLEINVGAKIFAVEVETVTLY
jgi:hypothetical protein